MRDFFILSAGTIALGIVACSVDDREVICEGSCSGVSEQGGASSGKGGAASSKGGVTGSGGDAPTSGGASGKGGASAGGKGGTSGGNAPTSGGASGRGGGPATSGGSSSGGTTGTGGSTPICRTMVASGVDPSIDDFEDGSLNISPLEGRAGTWIHLRSDSNGIATPPELLTGPKLGEETVAMGLGGLGILPVGTQYPWAHAQTLLYATGYANAPKSCVYNASAYDGIYFQAIGSVSIRLSAEMDLNVPVANTWGAPGACTANPASDCFDRYGQDILVDAEIWREYYVYWTDLSQLGVGAWSPAFSPARLHAVYFEIVPEPSGAIPEYGVIIDEVSFIPRGVLPPPNPAP